MAQFVLFRFCGVQILLFAYCIYRPPPSAKNKLIVPLFLDEFIDLLEILTCSLNKLVFVEDFNFHLDVPTYPHAIQFGIY